MVCPLLEIYPPKRLLRLRSKRCAGGEGVINNMDEKKELQNKQPFIVINANQCIYKWIICGLLITVVLLLGLILYNSCLIHDAKNDIIIAKNEINTAQSYLDKTKVQLNSLATYTHQIDSILKDTIIMYDSTSKIRDYIMSNMINDFNIIKSKYFEYRNFIEKGRKIKKEKNIENPN